MDLPERAWPFAGIVALVFVLGLSSLVGLVLLFEEKLIYFPSRELDLTPAELTLESEEVTLETEDGLRLYGWFLPAPSGGASEAAPLGLIYCHGNAGNIAHRLVRVAEMHAELGVDVLLFDYRGYGRSEGSPDEAGTYRDARAAYRYLVADRGIPADRIVLYGESLGAAVAVELATELPSRALVLESPFTSIADMARAVYPFLPARALLRTRYDSLAKIPEIRTPLLVVHGTEDATVPFEQGERLFERAPAPKRFLAVEGAGHSNVSAVAGERYWGAWRELLFTSSGS